MTLTAKRALYIKLGEGNRWAQLSFCSGTLRFGFYGVTHQMALDAAEARNFKPIRDFYEQKPHIAAGTATRYSNEIREFYTAGTDVLWITFAHGRMWWCFADDAVNPNPDGDHEAMGARYRKATSGWSDKDLTGKTLTINGLRGSLTTTAGFRGTICRVREFDYLLRRLNGQETAATEAVRDARKALIAAVKPLISGLHWKDFELLVELVMTQGGWRRVSATGGTQHTIDLELELPLTRERALVQVKSTLDQQTAENVAATLVESAAGSRVFIAYHTARPGPDELSIDQENVTVIGPSALAEHVVNLGLTTWIMEKVG